MNTTKITGLGLLFLAYILLVPGLIQPLLSLTGTVEKADMVLIGKEIIVSNPETPEFIGTMANALVDSMVVEGSVEAYQKTRSIVGTIQALYDDSYVLVAFLVALFSIVVPVVKGLLLLVSQMKISNPLKNRLLHIGDLLSKWSMADVFVVGVFVALLAANAIKKESGLLSFEAELGSGFYFFLSYCLVSILATQLITSSDNNREE